jgi:hypothetical protein
MCCGECLIYMGIGIILIGIGLILVGLAGAMIKDLWF